MQNCSILNINYGNIKHGIFGWIKTNPSAIALLVWFITAITLV